jgi:glycosyltransferase involved in cell wall biosynthesis
MTTLDISVVINTYNRALSLRKVLESFRWQNYPRFEIVVVNGPSTDDTEQVLAEYSGSIKVISCSLANISVSRNIGISHAAGDIVAFIDDDAIPYPGWLQGLAEQYTGEDVGGVGGFVWDNTGMSYQTRYVACDRFGEARFFNMFDPSNMYSFPSAKWYPSLMGVNSSFRRSVLHEIGGFNEIYAYFLDETDVCLRIIDRGYKIVFSHNANVHHKYLASHIRDTKRITRNYYPIIRSKTNFIMTHGSAARGRAFAEKRIRQWILERRIEVNIGWFFRDYSWDERKKALSEISAGYDDSMKSPCFVNDHLDRFFCNQLVPFPTLKKKQRIVLISADFPPMANGGIGALMKNISVGLSDLGNEVHVISRSEVETVDFEDGVWVHRIKPRNYEEQCVINSQMVEVPPSLRDWAGTAKKRVEFISSDYGRIDVVISPIWDLEGCYTLHSNQWKSVVTLHTTYAMSVDTHPEWKSDRHYFAKFVNNVIHAEKAILESSSLLMANSDGLVDELESVYGIRRESLNLVTVPHGVRDYMKEGRIAERTGRIRGLFVGRLELRKGADVLFDVLPEVLDQIPSLEFDVVGDDTIPVFGTKTILSKYRDSLMPYILQGRLRVHGKVQDDSLPGFYNACDFFVAPSRFESFGLILAEAMSCGKPVIACRAGGMIEVVGDAGLLSDPGDAKTLKEHIIKLASNAELRNVLGCKARDRFETHFSTDRMARKISAILEEIVNVNLA